MKFTAFFFQTILFCFLLLPAVAQTEPEIVDDRIYVAVEQMPVFPGGQDSMMAYLGGTIKYPAQALKDGREGLVVLSFVVDQAGQIGDINLLKSMGEELDSEAVRVVKSMPTWQPGKQNGRNVKVRYVLPIRFTIKPPNNTPKPGPSQEAPPEMPKMMNGAIMPQYPGGQTALLNFLAQNMKYPIAAQEHNIQGISLVSFVVDKDGTLGDFKIEKRLGYGTDREAIRVLKSMPKWIPGTKDGKPIRVKYTLPANFQLPNPQ